MSAFLHTICLPFLLRAQNADGGWGYHPASPSATEPTCWSVLALTACHSRGEATEVITCARRWLLGAQLADGSYPVIPGQRPSGWVTSLACLALSDAVESGLPFSRGIQWLCHAWPAEGNLWWRVRYWLSEPKGMVKQNHLLRGWSWTPGTGSWVEPTSYALLALRCIPPELESPLAARRRRLAEAMLYDRECPGGGWNCGNPLVYGVAGDPQVGPTAWALLALGHYADRRENQAGLDWLAHNYETIRGPASLALAHLCLTSYGRAVPPLEQSLERMYTREEYFHSIAVMAWAALALGDLPDWLQGAAPRGRGQ